MRADRECDVAHIGEDETSFRKHHTYVTIVSDAKAGSVLHVGEDRKKETLSQWYAGFTVEQLEGIESVSMDMWPAYIYATLEHVPEAQQRVAFDKFHMVKSLGAAVDKVRRQEHRALMKEGRGDLKGTKYDWLTHSTNKSSKQKVRFEQLRTSTLKTARAWAIKEAAMQVVAPCPPPMGT